MFSGEPPPPPTFKVTQRDPLTVIISPEAVTNFDWEFPILKSVFTF